jgi:hypothetical protein
MYLEPALQPHAHQLCCATSLKRLMSSFSFAEAGQLRKTFGLFLARVRVNFVGTRLRQLG